MIDPQLRRKIQMLLEAVQRDDSGALVAGIWMGGGGGLLSRETLVAADMLRKAMLEDERTVMPPDSGPE